MWLPKTGNSGKDPTKEVYLSLSPLRYYFFTTPNKCISFIHHCSKEERERESMYTFPRLTTRYSILKLKQMNEWIFAHKALHNVYRSLYLYIIYVLRVLNIFGESESYSLLLFSYRAVAAFMKWCHSYAKYDAYFNYVYTTTISCGWKSVKESYLRSSSWLWKCNWFKE